MRVIHNYTPFTNIDRLFNAVFAEPTVNACANSNCTPEAGASPEAGVCEVVRGFHAETFVDSNGYAIWGELPGVSKADLRIELDQTLLTITGIRKGRAETASTVRFSRQFRIPTDIDRERISASLVDGLLKVELPRSATMQPRMISVS